MLIIEKANYRLRFPIVTILLIVSFFVIYIFTDPLDYALIPSRHIDSGLYTSIFSHASLLHIIGNSIYLYIYGDNVEDVMGSLLYFPVFILSGILSNIIYLLIHFNSSIPLVGSSGAVSAIMGIYLILFPNVKTTIYFGNGTGRRGVSIPDAAIKYSFGLWIIIQVLLFILFEAGGLISIAFSAHIGGFTAGLLTGHLLRRNGFIDSHSYRIRKHAAVSNTILCPSCNTPKKVTTYGRYTCSQCCSEFIFDRKGKNSWSNSMDIVFSLYGVMKYSAREITACRIDCLLYK